MNYFPKSSNDEILCSFQIPEAKVWVIIMINCTVIPDIHADPLRLEASISVADGRKLAFLGDFIDAGSGTKNFDDARVLQRVRREIESGAVAVMGNHELNAILFHRSDKNRAPLRKHDEKNYKQHRSFIECFGIATPLAIYWTEWFLTLPLWHDKDGLRLVHACWDDEAVTIVKERRPDGRLCPEDLEEVAAKETPFALAVERLTSGVEVDLPTQPRQYRFLDAGGNWRTNVRVAWWRANGGTWRDVALSVPNPETLPDSVFVADDSFAIYPEGGPPVLVGHYKMQGDPRVEAGQAACLDYPEKYCVYHWSGEPALRSENLKSRSPGDPTWK